MRTLVILVAFATVAHADDDETPVRAEAAAGMDQLHIARRLGHTPQDLRNRAFALFVELCDAGDAGVCTQYGKVLTRAHDARNVDVLARACTLGSAEGCLVLGDHVKD